jgi:hypothetical protein
VLAAAVNDHLFWITSRAAGTLALLVARMSGRRAAPQAVAR